MNQLRYPAKPATSAYRPESADITRIVVGKLQDAKNTERAVDFAWLANRDDVHVSVDGHAIVVRHLAILAMTGSGKTWTARRIIEQLALKNYPIVVFDPRGDYTGLGEVKELKGRVTRYYADFPLLKEDNDTIMRIVNTLGYPLTDTMETMFGDLCEATKSFYNTDDEAELDERIEWLADRLQRDDLRKYGIRPDMRLIANLAEAGEASVRDATEGNAAERDPADAQQLEEWGWRGLSGYSKTDRLTLERIKKRCYKAASVLKRMEQINRKIATTNAQPLPTDKTELVKYGQVSVIALAGYTGDFQATIYSLIADAIFGARVSDDLKLPVLLVLEEAHNFAPGKAMTPAEERAITVTRQIAQEGRKFQVGLLMISQRPNRLDETALSMCNSYVIMKMINPADQNFVRRVVESLGEDDVRMLTNLDKGEAILTGEFISFPVLVKVKPPASRGEREEEDAFVALAKMKADADEAEAAKVAKSKKR